jgi:hypothetical protein
MAVVQVDRSRYRGNREKDQQREREKSIKRPGKGWYDLREDGVERGGEPLQCWSAVLSLFNYGDSGCCYSAPTLESTSPCAQRQERTYDALTVLNNDGTGRELAEGELWNSGPAYLMSLPLKGEVVATAESSLAR